MNIQNLNIKTSNCHSATQILSGIHKEGVCKARCFHDGLVWKSEKVSPTHQETLTHQD